jgi:hypothetical protein
MTIGAQRSQDYAKDKDKRVGSNRDSNCQQFWQTFVGDRLESTGGTVNYSGILHCCCCLLNVAAVVAVLLPMFWSAVDRFECADGCDSASARRIEKAHHRRLRWRR